MTLGFGNQYSIQLSYGRIASDRRGLYRMPRLSNHREAGLASLHRDDDFAELLVRFEVGVGLDDLVQ